MLCAVCMYGCLSHACMGFIFNLYNEHWTLYASNQQATGSMDCICTLYVRIECMCARAAMMSQCISYTSQLYGFIHFFLFGSSSCVFFFNNKCCPFVHHVPCLHCCDVVTTKQKRHTQYSLCWISIRYWTYWLGDSSDRKK